MWPGTRGQVKFSSFPISSDFPKKLLHVLMNWLLFINKSKKKFPLTFRRTQASYDHRLLWTSGDISSRPSRGIFVPTPRIALPVPIYVHPFRKFIHFWNYGLPLPATPQLHRFLQQFSAALPHHHPTALNYDKNKAGITEELAEFRRYKVRSQGAHPWTLILWYSIFSQKGTWPKYSGCAEIAQLNGNANLSLFVKEILIESLFKGKKLWVKI